MHESSDTHQQPLAQGAFQASLDQIPLSGMRRLDARLDAAHPVSVIGPCKRGLAFKRLRSSATRRVHNGKQGATLADGALCSGEAERPLRRRS